jgi:hypothetical protein
MEAARNRGRRYDLDLGKPPSLVHRQKTIAPAFSVTERRITRALS